MGLTLAPVRITEIQENSDGSLTFFAEDFTGTSFVPTPASQANAGFQFNFGVSPGGVTDALVFAPPANLVTGGGSGTTQLWITVAGNNANLGGFNIYTSVDNVAYTLAGSLVGSSTMGKLTANLPIGADPDNVNTLSVDLTESNGVLSTVTQASADALITLSYVDGELVAYETATLTAAHKYDLTYLRRGAYASTIGLHLVGTTFAYLGGGIFSINVPTAWLANPIYFKFQPFNIWGGGTPDLSTLPFYVYFNGSLSNVTIPVQQTDGDAGELAASTYDAAGLADPDPVANL
jgi:hypothetical protein